MPDKPRILFLGSDKHWFGVLGKAVGSQAELFQYSLENLSVIQWNKKYKIMIVDTLDVSKKKLSAMVKSLIDRQPRAQVIVVSASPTWTAVREALKAGAVDYFVKSFDPVKIANDLRPYLS